MLVMEEMPAPIGIPDLTALVGSTSDVTARLALAIPPLLHEVDAGIVSAAHAGKPKSVEALAESLGWPESTVERRLGKLLRCGALIEVRPNAFVRPHALRPLGRLYAVEAKVDNWVQAIKQARSYALWSDAYVLVLGNLSPRTIQRVLVEVDHDRAGLVVSGKWFRRPAVAKVPNRMRLWASEHFIAALPTSNHQPSVWP
jgi:DNA-binding Lrp family transcriptional regulator